MEKRQPLIESMMPAPVGWRAVYLEPIHGDGGSVEAGVIIRPVIGWAVQHDERGERIIAPIVAFDAVRAGEWSMFDVELNDNAMAFLDPSQPYDEADWLPIAREELQRQVEFRKKMAERRAAKVKAGDGKN